jgi:hypothetical protein
MFPQILKNRRVLKAALTVCNSWALYRSSLIFGVRESVKVQFYTSLKAMFPQILKNRRVLKAALTVCNSWALYRSSLIFGVRESVKVQMFQFFWQEYQMDYLGLSELRESSSPKQDLLMALMHMQADAGGELGHEFRCLGKVVQGLSQSTSKWEKEPESHKFVLSQFSDVWHISTALQTYSFLISKKSSRYLIIEKIIAEMHQRNISVLYGVFRKGMAESLVSTFNNIYGCNLTTTSFEKFISGTRARRYPNAKYQEFTQIDRKTYYKLVNFFEAISPGHWVMSNIDSKRIKGDEAMKRIKELVLEDCDDGLRAVWEDALERAREYSDKVELRRFDADAIRPTREFLNLISLYNSKLGSLRRHKNRLPVLIKDYNLYNLLKLTKKRPCPVKPYIDYIKYRPPFQIQRTKDLMEDIRSLSFKVNEDLRKEAIERDEEVKSMHRDILKAEARVRYSRIKAQKKEAKHKALLEKAAKRMEQEKVDLQKRIAREEAKRISRERWEAQRKAEEERSAILRAEAEERRRQFAATLPPPRPPRRTANFWTILDINQPMPPVSVSREEQRQKSEEDNARRKQESREEKLAAKKQAREEILAKTKEIAKRWKNHPDPELFLSEAISEIKEFGNSKDSNFCSNMVRILKRRVKDTPRNEDIRDFEGL